MLIQVDWYKETGKWYCGALVEVNAKPFENEKVINEIIKNQSEIIKDWWMPKQKYMVLNDIPESVADPNYRTTYARLYTPEQIFRWASGY